MIFFTKRPIKNCNTQRPYIRIHRYILCGKYVESEPVLVSPFVLSELDIREAMYVSKHFSNGEVSRILDILTRPFRSSIPADMCRVRGEKCTIFSVISNNISRVPVSKGSPHYRRTPHSEKERRRQAVRILRALKKIPDFTLSDESKQYLRNNEIMGPNVLLEFWLADNCDKRSLSERIFRTLAHEDCRQDIFEAFTEENKVIASLFLHRNKNIHIKPFYNEEDLFNKIKENFKNLKKELTGDTWIFAALLFGNRLHKLSQNHFESGLRQFFSRTSESKSTLSDEEWIKAANKFHRLYTEQTESALSQAISPEVLPLYKKLKFLTTEKSFALFTNPEYLAALMNKKAFLTLAKKQLLNKNNDAKLQVLRCLEVFKIPVEDLLNRKMLSELIIAAASYTDNPDILKPLITHKLFVDEWLTIIANNRCWQYGRYIHIDGFSISPEKINQLLKNTDFLDQDPVYQLQLLLKLQDYLLPKFHEVLKDKIAVCTPRYLAQAGRNGIEDFAKASRYFTDAAHSCFYVFLTSGEYKYASQMLSNGFTLNCNTFNDNAFKLSSEERVRAVETINRLFRHRKISEPRKKEMLLQIEDHSGCTQQPESPESATHRFWPPANSSSSILNSEQSSPGLESEVGIKF